MPLFLLDPDQPERFPPTRKAQRVPNGLLAIGGDLRPDRLLAAYGQGIFPWFSEGEPPLWWAPDPRCVLLPEQIHVSRRWVRWLRSCDWQIRVDTDFAGVIERCALPREPGGGTWIVPAMVAAYCDLHALGYAHSIEVYADGAQVGGLYGVSLGAAFFAESMYSRRSNGSKVALLALCRLLQSWGFELIDVQMESEHLLRMGARSWPRAEFEQALAQTQARATVCGPWTGLCEFSTASSLVGHQ